MAEAGDGATAGAAGAAGGDGSAAGAAQSQVTGGDKGGAPGAAGTDRAQTSDKADTSAERTEGTGSDDSGDEHRRDLAERAKLNPLGVPDKFLDRQGRPDFAKLVKSYKDGEQALMRRGTEVRAEVEREFHESRVKAAPATPGDYKLEDTFILGDRQITMIKDDPMLAYVREVAHQNQWTQKQFDENVRGYVARQIASLPKWSAEAEKLGPNADARHSRVDGFLRGNLSEATYKTFAAMPATAALITAIEEVMELAGHPKITDDVTEIPRETLNRDQLKAMQSDPRYTGEKGRIDQAFVNRVRAGYRALSKNGRAR